MADLEAADRQIAAGARPTSGLSARQGVSKSADQPELRRGGLGSKGLGQHPSLDLL
jgi:hypothetical protein